MYERAALPKIHGRRTSMDNTVELSELNGMQAAASASDATDTQLGRALWLKIVLTQGVLNLAAKKFWTHPELPRLFPHYLLELYSMMSCSVPLMHAGYERASELTADDPLAATTAAYLELHIQEESHHDEWLLDDLVAGRMEREAVRHRPPGAEVARLVGSQYCWIRHAHPAALLGYLAVLESNPPLEEHLAEIQAQTGYPAESFRCLRLHAADDIEHLRGLKTTIERLPLNAESAALISASAFATMQGLVALLDKLTNMTA
jgi:hypothetical protein